MSRAVGAGILAFIATIVLLAPVLAPNDPTLPLRDRAYAPPTRPHLFGSKSPGVPYIYDQVLVDRLRRTYTNDHERPIAIQWFRGGRVLSTAPDGAPLLLLGADPLGRDVFSRLLHGASRSLGVSLAGALGALILGALVGAMAGTAGGRIDAVSMALADFVIVLPAAYLVLVLRGLLPLELSTVQIFWLIAAFFALAAWPPIARGVRAIVIGERARDYAEAARAAGAGPWRLARHLLPAARGFLAIQAVLVLPALLLAEVTISFVGLGFGDSAPSWGTMLHDLANVRIITEAPWMLAPAVAIFVVVLAVQLVVGVETPVSVLHARRGVRAGRFDTTPA